MAKAIASGDQRLMEKGGLEADIARLERLRAAHIDDQHAVRRQIRDAERDIEFCTRRIADVGKDIERRALRRPLTPSPRAWPASAVWSARRPVAR